MATANLNDPIRITRLGWIFDESHRAAKRSTTNDDGDYGHLTSLTALQASAFGENATSGVTYDAYPHYAGADRDVRCFLKRGQLPDIKALKRTQSIFQFYQLISQFSTLFCHHSYEI